MITKRNTHTQSEKKGFCSSFEFWIFNDGSNCWQIFNSSRLLKVWYWSWLCLEIFLAVYVLLQHIHYVICATAMCLFCGKSSCVFPSWLMTKEFSRCILLFIFLFFMRMVFVRGIVSPIVWVDNLKSLCVIFALHNGFYPFSWKPGLSCILWMTVK